MATTHLYYTFNSGVSKKQSDEDRSSSPSLVEVGGKALSLIESAAGMFPVPPGLVLTVAFFEPWVEQIKKRPEWEEFMRAGNSATKEHCDAVKMSCSEENLLELSLLQKQELDAALAEAFEGQINKDDNENGTEEPNKGHSSSFDLEGMIFAVRSSSPEEDLLGSSFAGGYDTTLGVTGANLLPALIASFSSMFDYRIVQYKLQNNMPIDNPRIAIVIQKQIASDISGVAFSINPNNNCYDEVVISANFGLGESVVGGIVTPDLYIVDKVTNEITSKTIANKADAIWLGKNKDGTKDNSSTSGGGTRQEKNEDPTAQALDDVKILEVAQLVAKVEEFRGGNVAGTDTEPVDIEWAFQDGTLYLLQARPVTAYIPLFPELVTKRGEEKYLYLDVIVMSQGFSEPMSVLGLNVWKEMLKKVKPNMSTEGKDGVIWNIHGREYMHVSNFMKSTGGRKLVENVYPAYDKAFERAFATISLDDYTPARTPEGAKGILWKQLKQLGQMFPSMIYALFKGEESMTEYVENSERIIELFHDDKYLENEYFDKMTETVFDKITNEIVLKFGAIVAPMLSRWRLSRIFSDHEETKDLLISLCMDLDGNPTSEMGHAMVRLASFSEIREIESSEEFMTHLKKAQKEEGGSKKISSEFLLEYTDFMKRFGCRGMKEIDMASPRTYENEKGFFDRLKQIDVDKNAIHNVSKRRDEAYEKLLAIAKTMGKEAACKYHANLIQRILGYREHPKYMLVVMVDLLRRRALKIGKEFFEQGRLEKSNQIFDLTIKQISDGQRDSQMKLLPLIEENLRPYKVVEHVKNWPMLIDSRGKIIRGEVQRKQHKEEQDDDNNLITYYYGDPISPGIVKGKAKVLHEPYEKPLLSGEILVARFTEPSWTPIFINASGVIMEIGGPLQHGAIIAREYGIPCVSGVNDATTVIKDGDMLELDGSEGTIKVIRQPKDAGLGDEKNTEGEASGADAVGVSDES